MIERLVEGMIGLEKYYFLFALGLAWIIFAVVQDLRKREVANWLNFSLLGFALAYRVFYSSSSGNWSFLLFGLMGAGMFFVLANLFYYTRVFAGGDAKLLIALGAVLPFESFIGLAYTGLGFIILLFLVGSVYSMIYSVGLAVKNRKKFAVEFRKNGLLKINWLVVPVAFTLCLAVLSLWAFNLAGAIVYGTIISFFFFFLFVYLKSLDCCMVKLVPAGELTEGDWLEKEMRVGRRVIGRSVHGLSVSDIDLLRKSGKNAWIKEGIPFTPAFLASFILMVSFFLALELGLPAFEKIALLF